MIEDDIVHYKDDTEEIDSNSWIDYDSGSVTESNNYSDSENHWN